MGKSSPSPPPSPDPTALIAAQQGANSQAIREAALINQFNQVTPFGARTFSGELGTPGRTETISLSPSSQRQFGAQNSISEVLLGLAGQTTAQLPTNAFNFDSIAGLPTVDSLDQDALRVEQSVFERSRRLLDGVFDSESRKLESNLAARGIPFGSEAYASSFGDLNRRRQESLVNAADDAVQASRAEQTRQVELGLRRRQQGINELLTQRGQPFNELSALLGGVPAFQVPDFSSVATVPTLPIDVVGATNQAQNAAFRNFSAQSQGDPSGLLGLGLSFLGSVL